MRRQQESGKVSSFVIWKFRSYNFSRFTHTTLDAVVDSCGGFLNKLALVLLALIFMLLAITACNSMPFLAQNDATGTPSRTPRPTFTPKPRPTDTPEVIDTPEVQDTETPEGDVTETPENVDATPTNKPAAPPAATRKPQPTTPPQPTVPTFPITISDMFPCPQDGIYEVTVSVKKQGKPGHRPYAAGLYFAAFDQSGRLLQDGAGKNLIAVTGEESSVSFGANCQREASRLHPDSPNGKLDVGDAAHAGTTNMLIRFIKSPTDLTPISADMPVNFGTGARLWVYLDSQ